VLRLTAGRRAVRVNKDDISSSEVTPNGPSVVTDCLLRFGGDPGELMAEEQGRRRKRIPWTEAQRTDRRTGEGECGMLGNSSNEKSLGDGEAKHFATGNSIPKKIWMAGNRPSWQERRKIGMKGEICLYLR